MTWIPASILATLAAAVHLTFLPPTPCGAAHDVSQCAAAGPKAWTEAERRLIDEAMQRLLKHDEVRGLVSAVIASGYRGFQRYTTDTQRNASGEHVSKFGPGFVLYTPKTIGITDAFFALAERVDGRGGYRLGDLVLLHELVHAFDHRSRSTAKAFTAATGWTFQDGRWVYTRRVSVSHYNGVYAETLTLYARGRYDEAWRRDREFATSLGSPLPRIQALVSPAETFADTFAHLVLDSTARDYLPRDLQHYFDTTVFPELRALGK